jgi:hypothetical protein
MRARSTLAAVEGGRTGQHLPLKLLVGEAVADPDLHRQQGNGARTSAGRRSRQDFLLMWLNAPSAHSIT